MKLLKYVMTHDSGLAPNPFFGVCSLALCTPNHMNVRLVPGDWVVGHSTKATGNRLVYAMRLTKVLGMDEYFHQFPAKRPDPDGSIEQQYGDNLYFRENDRWRRLPSAQHNWIEAFRHDQGRRVYLAEGTDRFWYFGADNSAPFLAELMDRFPWLVQGRQGFTYVHDVERIHAFGHALEALGQSGQLGRPRDQQQFVEDSYLISIDPEPLWLKAPQDDRVLEGPTVNRCGARWTLPNEIKRGC
ncbi:hypothetical protein RAM80_28920 [Pseudomonas sp. App30]|uniref:Nmad2 family putative nucleotide modification protein n=1 Tax=Pseudomonas sp. App30 TaxID=3068990 RepID=UPI003A804973